jgi:hypothetical protein
VTTALGHGARVILRIGAANLFAVLATEAGKALAGAGNAAALFTAATRAKGGLAVETSEA